MAFSIGSSLVNATASGLKMPGIPTINTITLTSATAGSMAFTPGLPPGFTYSVTTTPVAGTGTGTVTPIAISGLTGNTSYTFRLTAYRMTLSKSATSASYLTKPNAVTIGAVTSLEITTASVGYTSPVGGAATYTITTSPVGGTGNTIVGANPIPVTGLAGNTSYTFTVTASNATGSSSSTTTASYLTKPTIVTIGTVSSITSSGASVAYTYATGNAATYTITTTPAGGIGTGASPISVTSLAANTSYTFTVTASNATGSNASTTTSSYVTKPGDPTLSTITVTGLTASVAYIAPTGGATTYTAYTSPTGGSGTSTTSPIAVSGLSANTSYAFTIYASNGAGTSSMVSSGSTYLTRPDAPTISTVTVTSSTAVSIPFTVAGTTSNITAIAITSSPSITLTYTATAPTFTGQSATVAVTGTFVVGTEYSFIITVTNAKASASSLASNLVTPLTTRLIHYYRFMSIDIRPNRIYLLGWDSESTQSSTTLDTSYGVSETSINPIQNFYYINVNGNTGASSIGASILFGGSNINTIASSAFTVAFWFNSLNSNGNWIFTLQTKDSNNNNINVSVNRSSSDANGNIIRDYFTSTNFSNSTINYNTWHHYAIVCKSGSPVKYYLDGTLVTSSTTYTWTGSLTTNRFSLGYGTSSNNGFYADVRFYLGALSDSGVSALSGSSYTVIEGSAVTDLGAYNIIPWGATTPDTGARWIWNDAYAANGALTYLYLNFFRIFYSSTNYTATIYAAVDNVGTLYFNGEKKGVCAGGWNSNGNSFSVNVFIGYNVVNIVGYNEGANSNPAGAICVISDGTSYVMHTDSNWRYVSWPYST